MCLYFFQLQPESLPTLSTTCPSSGRKWDWVKREWLLAPEILPMSLTWDPPGWGLGLLMFCGPGLYVYCYLSDAKTGLLWAQNIWKAIKICLLWVRTRKKDQCFKIWKHDLGLFSWTWWAHRGFLEVRKKKLRVRDDEEAGKTDIWIHWAPMKTEKTGQPKEWERAGGY